MTAERLKIRCYQCNQLMAVAPTKIGLVVACPRCKTDLLVPRPDPAVEGVETILGGQRNGPGAPTLHAPTGSSDSAVPLSSIEESEPETGPDAGPGLLETEFASMLPPELAALRPEDLRVEAEFHRAQTHLTEPPPRVSGPSSPAMTRVAAPSSPAMTRVTEPSSPTMTRVSEPPSPATPRVAPPSRPASRPREREAVANTVSIDAPPNRPRAEAETELVVPPIQIEPSISLAPRPEPRVVREVTLPASVVLAWSVFVLASIGMAFIAGLLIGHFVWRHVS